MNVQIPGLRKLEQRTQIAGAGGVNDDDALALFELGDDVVAVHRRKQQRGDGEEEPEPRQAVTLRAETETNLVKRFSFHGFFLNSTHGEKSCWQRTRCRSTTETVRARGHAPRLLRRQFGTTRQAARCLHGFDLSRNCGTPALRPTGARPQTDRQFFNMTKPNEKNIVFLSHSSRDKKQLVPFKKALEEKTNGTIQFFLSSDGQSIPLGHNWVASVEHSLDEAKLAFVFLTPNSVGSPWVAFEAGFMHSKKIKVIPVALPGIELGQVAPPVGLLQGFNMHSHETMNNVFEILNHEFQHQHKGSFTADDFRKLFGADSELAAGFFGEYSAFVNKITFDGKTKDQSLLPALKADLAKQNILLVEGGKPDDPIADCPGLSARTNTKTNWFRLELHREMFSVILPCVCSVLKQVTAPDPKYSAYIDFIPGITGGGFGVHVTACAYGTEFDVRPEGFVRFRKISLGHGIENPLHLESSFPFEEQDIHDLVVNLFESGMLEFKPAKEIDPMIAGIARVVLQMRRRF